MANSTNVGVVLVLSAMNRADAVINSMTTNAINRMNAVQQKANTIADASFKNGRQMATTGLAIAAPILATVKAYADLEESQITLQTTMMNGQGKVNKYFEDTKKLAIDIGNLLPGTTAEVNGMFETMMNNGANAQNILNGTGRAAANLAVLLKLPFNVAGEFAMQIRQATGTADRDMSALFTDIVKTRQLGVSVDEMSMAYARSAGALKTFKIQGLEATKQLDAVYAMLIRNTKSGEKTGTGFSAILYNMYNPKNLAKFNSIASGMGLSMKFMDKKGDFLGLDNMMQQFDKMHNLSTIKKNALVNALVGTGADGQLMSILINEGMQGYQKIISAKKNMADNDKKIALILDGMKAKYDAVEGSIVNTAADIGQKLRPQIVALLAKINDILPKVQAFVENNKGLVVMVLKGAAAFSAFSIGVGALSFMFGGTVKAVSLTVTAFKYIPTIIKGLNFAFFALRYSMITSIIPAMISGASAAWAFTAALLANPITYIVLGIAGAAYLIYKNWDKISGFFVKVWDRTKEVFKTAVGWVKGYVRVMINPVGEIYSHWGGISKFFGAVWDRVTGVFKKGLSWFVNIHKAFFNAGANIVRGIWEGIKSLINKPVEAIAAMTKKMRAYLPFSPAKEGALRDIHKVRLVETIAEGLNAKPLLNAWGGVMGELRGKIGGNGAGPVGGAGGDGRRSIGGMVFAPVINISGGATKEQADMVTGELRQQFTRFMMDWEHRKKRVQY